MKKRWMVSLIVLALITISVWLVYRFAIQDNMHQLSGEEKQAVEHDYKSLDEAKTAALDIRENRYAVTGTNEYYYKLANGAYVVHQLIYGSQLDDTYFLNDWIQVDAAGKSQLTLGEPFEVHIMKNGKFRTVEWTDETPIGQVEYASGDLDRGDDLSDVEMVNDQETQGFQIRRSHQAEVIYIDGEGHWYDAANFAVGSKQKMKRYSSVEEAAVAADAIKDKGTLLKALDSQSARYYIYQHPYADFNEYTVLPVIKKEGYALAGKYHRFTFLNDQNADSEINTEFEDELEGHPYTLHFTRNSEQPLKSDLQLQHGRTLITIQE